MTSGSPTRRRRLISDGRIAAPAVSGVSLVVRIEPEAGEFVAAQPAKGSTGKPRTPGRYRNTAPASGSAAARAASSSPRDVVM